MKVALIALFVVSMIGTFICGFLANESGQEDRYKPTGPVQSIDEATWIVDHAAAKWKNRYGTLQNLSGILVSKDIYDLVRKTPPGPDGHYPVLGCSLYTDQSLPARFVGWVEKP